MRSHARTQMFTDFVAECRAGRLKARLTSVDTGTIRRKDESILKEAPELTAVAA